MFRTFQAFFLRDFRQSLSYRFAFFLDLGSVFFNAATFYFVAQLFGSHTPESLTQFGGGYFPFVLIGIAFSTYQTVGMTSFAQSLRQEQFIGTMESILATPIKISTFLTGSALWDFFYATAEVALYFILGFAVFGLTLNNAHVLAALTAFVLTLISFMGLGVLAAAFVLLYKKGNPVTWLVATVGELLGGVYFPPEILPPWLQSIANWIPMTNALRALRLTLLSGAGFWDIQKELVYLFIFSILIWTTGILMFQWALRKTKEDGTLGHY